MTSAVILFLAGLLALSAAHKVLARDRMALSVARLTGFSPPIAGLVLIAVTCIEGVLALSLMLSPLATAGAVGAAALWTLYAGALLRRRGESLDCGCDLMARKQPVDGFTIVRPLVPAGLAVAAALLPRGAWTLDAPFAAAAFLALWFAAGELHSLHSLRVVRS